MGWRDVNWLGRVGVYMNEAYAQDDWFLVVTLVSFVLMSCVGVLVLFGTLVLEYAGIRQAPGVFTKFVLNAFGIAVGLLLFERVDAHARVLKQNMRRGKRV